MTKVIDIIRKAERPFASFELVPPLKGTDCKTLIRSLEPIFDFHPPFINVTFHRDEVEFQLNSDGSYTRQVLTRRPGTIAMTAAIMRHYDGEVVPHVVCGGASMMRIESELLDLNFLGIDNVMALRGDAMPGQKRFQPDVNGFAHSDELVSMISELNKGHYLDPNVKQGVATNFCVGVAGYPEKHADAANLDVDIANLKRKVDAGADYIITQMFFDNTRFYEFVNRCRAAGITVPIIPGLKPLSGIRQIEMLPRTFHLDIPRELTDEINAAKSKDAVYEIGKEWCLNQCRDLLAHGISAIHFYTMGKSENVMGIVKALF